MLNKVDQRKLDIKIRVDACLKVERMLNTEGWKEIVEPLLNAMIEDVTGRKKDGRWIKGWVYKEDAKKALGFQEALILFYNKIMDYKEQRIILEQSYMDIDKKSKKTFVTPMERSKYAVKKERVDGK